MNLLLLALAMLLAEKPVEPKPVPALIRGEVVMAESNKPVGGASVVLMEAADPFELVNGKARQFMPPKTTKTDPNGVFIFDKVQPGDYRVDVKRTPDYMRIPDEANPRLPGLRVTVRSGEPENRIQLEVSPNTSISGRIVDRKGKPVEGVPVAATLASYESGQRIIDSWLSPGGSTTSRARTDQRGEYTISGLQPGQYYVVANSQALWGMAFTFTAPDWCDWNHSGTNGGQRNGPVSPYSDFSLDVRGAAGRSAPVSYFPGVADPGKALPIDIHTGEKRERVNFTAEAAPRSTSVSVLKGTVVDAATGKRAQSAEVWVTPRDRSQMPCVVKADHGSFQATGLPAGEYELSANLNGAPARMAGRITIDTAHGKPKNVVIPVAPLFHVRGRIVVDGKTALGEPDLSRFFVNLEPDPDVDSARLTYAPVARDGSFDIQGVMGWDYRVSLRSPSPDAYVQTIRFGSEDILINGLHLNSQPVTDLEIVIRNDGGAVAGVAPTPKDKPLGALTVVLVPDAARRNRQDLYRTLSPGENGEFHARGVPPGDYQVFAWERAVDGSWTDPEFMRLYDTQGTAVQIRGGETATTTLKPIAPWK